MLLLVEKGIRGGVSTISHRYGEADNPYMGNKCDETKPSKYLTYLDANNLYGWAMSQDLPTGGFGWITFNKVKGVGCISEVDLEYTDEMHNFHNDYPLAPENVKVNKVHKLIQNLNNKKK